MNGIAMAENGNGNGNGRRRIVISDNFHFSITLGAFMTVIFMLWKVFRLVAIVEDIPKTEWNVHHESAAWGKFSELNIEKNLKVPDAYRIKRSAGID